MSDLPAPLRRTLELSLEPASSAFHTAQVSISFGEAVDAAALRAAWEAVARDNPALRTILEDETLREEAAAAFAWRELDWQGDPPADLGAEWQALFDADGATPVAAEPHRFVLIRLPNGHGHALWTFHAALLDEDSVSAALHRWLIAYDHLRTGAAVPTLTADAPDPAAVADEEISSPPPLLVLPLPEEAPFGVRRSLAHTYERPERAAFAAAAQTADTDLRALATAAWSFVVARAHDAEDAHLLETSRPAAGLGRFEDYVLRRRPVAAHATATDLIRACAETPAPLRAQIQNPRARIAFVYRPLTLNDRLQLELPRWMAADAQIFVRTAAPIALRFVAGDRPTAALDYDPSALSDDAARALFHAFRGTLEAFADDPGLALESFALPGTPAVVFAPEAAPTFRSLVTQGIHEMFGDAAAETPDTIAVEAAGESLTFAQLHTQSNQVARLLRKRGVNAGARIGIGMERSPQWVAALLGALKAGGSIVLPAPGAAVDAWIVDALAEGDDRHAPVVQMRIDASALHAEKSRGVSSETEPSSPALSWTVQGETHTFDHATLAASLQSLAALLELSPADRVLQFAPTDQIAAVEETLATVLSGATLVLRPNHPWGTRTAFQEFVQEKSVSALAIPTAFWTQWAHYLAELSLTAPATLRLAVTTGALPAPNAAAAWPAIAGSARWLHRTATPRTGGLGLAGVPEGDFASASLGQPGPATVARIADRHGLTQPLGFPGHAEIAPASAPEAFRSLEIPALSTPDGAFYDLAAFRARLGDAGRDISAAGIRAATIAHPQVFDAYAESRLIAARQEWCLWIVPRDSEAGEPHDLRDWLVSQLGQAPRRIRAVPRFPLDDAGQLDIAALGELQPDEVAAPAARPGTADEERLRDVLSRALGGRRVDLDEILTDGRAKPPVAQRLFEAAARVEPRVELGDFTTGFSVRSLLRNVRGRTSAPDSKWTPLEPLRASGKRPPIIFLHDLEGTSRVYAPLVAHLGDDQPCYGITARGLADPAAAQASVEEMAATYVAALRVFDAAGPYRLVGYGFGGLLAFEMARQLGAQGAEIALVALLATEPPVGTNPSGLLAGGWKRALPALFGRKSTEPRRGGETPVYRANQEAARKYTASAAPFTAHLFIPEVDFPAYRGVQAGWNACCADARFYQVPCSGPDMMDEPAAEELAHVIAKLARAEDLSDEIEE